MLKFSSTDIHSKLITPALYVTTYILKFGIPTTYYESDNYKRDDKILRQCLENYDLVIRDPDLANSGTGWNPIHLASLMNDISVVRIIIGEKNVDPNTVFHFNKTASLSPTKITPLGCAVFAQSSEVFNYLLSHGADEKFEFDSLIFWTVKGGNGNAEILENFLRGYYRSKSDFVIDLCTMIIHDALPNDTELLKIILRYSPLSAFKETEFQQNTAYLATSKGLYILLDLLIKFGVSFNKCTKLNFYPIQSIFMRSYHLHFGDPIMSEIKSDEVGLKTLKVLLENTKQHNMRSFLNNDKYEAKFPLHLAAHRGYTKCTFELIKFGAEIPVRTLDLLSQRIPNFIQMHLDNLITLQGVSSSNSRSLVRIDLGFTGSINSRDEELCETSFLKFLIEDGQHQFLHHPVIETYLTVKWIFVRKYFFISLMLYLLMLIPFSHLVLTNFVGNTENQDFDVTITNISSNFEFIFQPAETQKHREYGFLYWLSLLMVFINGTKLLLQFFLSPSVSMKKYEIWMASIINCLVFIVHLPFENVNGWQTVLAAITILLAWLYLLHFLRRHPTLGIYVSMFYKVISNLFRLMLTYLCLLLGFTISFMVLNKGNPPFKNLFYSLLLTLNMMIGELEFDDMVQNKINQLKSSEPEVHQVLFHFLFAIFIFVISIALINLLIGLAVSDIKGLRKKSKTYKTMKQIDFTFEVEGFLFSKNLQTWLPKYVVEYLVHSIMLQGPHKFFNRHRLLRILPGKFVSKRKNPGTFVKVKRPNFIAKLLKPFYKSSNDQIGKNLQFVHIYPNDANDKRLPRLVKAEALQIAIRNKQKQNEVDSLK